MIFSEKRLPPIGSSPRACFSESCSRRARDGRKSDFWPSSRVVASMATTVWRWQQPFRYYRPAPRISFCSRSHAKLMDDANETACVLLGTGTLREHKVAVQTLL